MAKIKLDTKSGKPRIRHPKNVAEGPAENLRKASKPSPGLYPYQPSDKGLTVSEPPVAYAIAPLESSVEETLALLSPLEQAEILEVSSKTLTRWRNKGETLTLQQTDRVAVIESIFKMGERIVGSREDMMRWIHSPIHYLDCQLPIELLKTERGRRRVEEALHAIEWGMLA